VEMYLRFTLRLRNVDSGNFTLCGCVRVCVYVRVCVGVRVCVCRTETHCICITKLGRLTAFREVIRAVCSQNSAKANKFTFGRILYVKRGGHLF